MSLNLIHVNRNDDQTDRTAANWAALTAISATDTSSRLASKGYVTLACETIVAIAALLAATQLTNGEVVTTYDFTERNGEKVHYDAHVNAFGPSLLSEKKLARLREILGSFPVALVLLDEIVELGLQVRFTTASYLSEPMPHLQAVNSIADEVEIHHNVRNMHAMLRALGIKTDTRRECGEITFTAFAAAVNDNASLIEIEMADRLRRFVACGQRQSATHVYWRKSQADDPGHTLSVRGLKTARSPSCKLSCIIT